MAHRAKSRTTMGVIVDNSSGSIFQDRILKATAMVSGVKPLRTQEIRPQIMAKMSITPAPRKSGTMGGSATADDGKRIGPPDATITGRKIGLGGMILIGVGILTVLALIGGRGR